jgi:hypothetical protein
MAAHPRHALRFSLFFLLHPGQTHCITTGAALQLTHTVPPVVVTPQLGQTDMLRRSKTVQKLGSMSWPNNPRTDSFVDMMKLWKFNLFALVANVAAASPSPSPAQALQARLDAAIQQRAVSFTIPAGVYNFSLENFNISGAMNLRVSATGVTVWFGIGIHATSQPGVNISNCEGLHVSGLAINYYGLTPSRSGHPGITYNVLNSSDVVSEDITIYKAPFFSVTAFNGGGGHIFRRFHMPNDTVVPWSVVLGVFFPSRRSAVLLLLPMVIPSQPDSSTPRAPRQCIFADVPSLLTLCRTQAPPA